MPLRSRLRRPPPAALIGIAVAVVVLVVALAVGLGSSGGGSKAGRPCGGATVTAPDGTTWTCTFDDEFDGSTLDRHDWAVTRSSQYGFHAGPECYVDDRRHVAVADGHLTLTATRSATPCAITGGAFESGMVTSLGHFSQTYGRFEVRARLPDTAGVQPALWLYPVQTNYGAWPSSGEIDIAEVFGGTGATPTAGTDKVTPHLHYLGLDGQGASVGQACTVHDPDGAFHTYAVDWTPSVIRFSYDGRTCQTIRTWQPAAPLQQPAPFNAPFYILLELGLGSAGGATVPDAATALPATMTVDWVRAWGH